MQEETFNQDLRRFLKRFGITAQREIERAVRSAMEEGRLRGDETLAVSARLEIDGLGETTRVDGSIALE